MKKILFISTTLGGGGAERIISYLLNEFSQEQDKEVILLLLKKEGNSYLDYVSSNVKIINLDITTRIRYAVFQILGKILSINPDVCYIGLDKLNIMFAMFLPIMKLRKIHFIVRETNVLSLQYNSRNIFIRVLYKYLYNLYDVIIAQSKDMRQDLIKVWKILPEKIILINNPVRIDDVINKSHELSSVDIPVKKRKLIAIGRLTGQKGYDILLQRMAELEPFIPFHLLILGEGPLREQIEEQIQQLNLGEYVTLLGFQENPYSFLGQSDGIILSSRHEGFPNVLLEANSLGLPIFSNQCLGGINEIVIEGINGITCDFEDKEAFQKALCIFLSTKFDNSAIQELTRCRYDISVIIPEYRKVFQMELER